MENVHFEEPSGLELVRKLKSQVVQWKGNVSPRRVKGHKRRCGVRRGCTVSSCRLGKAPGDTAHSQSAACLVSKEWAVFQPLCIPSARHLCARHDSISIYAGPVERSPSYVDCYWSSGRKQSHRWILIASSKIMVLKPDCIGITREL